MVGLFSEGDYKRRGLYPSGLRNGGAYIRAGLETEGLISEGTYKRRGLHPTGLINRTEKSLQNKL